jgi:L-aminopeptidase/D-esterase-like protein
MFKICLVLCVILKLLCRRYTHLNNVIDELTPQDEAFKNTLLDQATQALGQAGALILTGGLTGAGKGATALISQAPKGAAATALKILIRVRLLPGVLSKGF